MKLIIPIMFLTLASCTPEAAWVEEVNTKGATTFNIECKLEDNCIVAAEQKCNKKFEVRQNVTFVYGGTGFSNEKSYFYIVKCK